VICAKSKFFHAACSERWKDSKEGQEKVVHLPEVEPETFQRYIDWTYRDALTYCDTLDTENEIRAAMVIRLYLLGDLLDDAKLRNKTMKALMRHVTIDLLHPSAITATVIWEKTTTGSLLRKLVVDSTVMILESRAFEEHIEEWPAGLVQQVAVRLKHQTSNMKPEELQAKLEEYLEAEEDRG
jgi:hypothetical protein